MNDAPKITITWSPPYDINVTFPQNPILCAFMLAQARKTIDKHFDVQPSLIQAATALLPSLVPGR